MFLPSWTNEIIFAGEFAAFCLVRHRSGARLLTDQAASNKVQYLMGAGSEVNENRVAHYI